MMSVQNKCLVSLFVYNMQNYLKTSTGKLENILGPNGQFHIILILVARDREYPTDIKSVTWLPITSSDWDKMPHPWRAPKLFCNEVKQGTHHSCHQSYWCHPWPETVSPEPLTCFFQLRSDPKLTFCLKMHVPLFAFVKLGL